jgi:OOP family OmpA-OmpF porin
MKTSSCWVVEYGELIQGGNNCIVRTDAYNIKLSQQRAEAVVAWLIAHGVTVLRLTAKGFGESQPVADNTTAVGRALNRRVGLVAQ